MIVTGSKLTKTFKDFWGRPKALALQEVDLEIREGTIFGLLGPNGAGKSTLIKLILGHLYPTRGLIAVFGKSPRDVEVKSRMGYLPERSYFYKNLTAMETLSYFGAILNLSKGQIADRSRQLLDMVGLDAARHRLIGEFSHGMSRRMGLAQALLNDPDFLILDEPTAGLDPIGCREVKDLIVTLGRRGKTILLTSHLLADVEDVCDEIQLLYGGITQARGSIASLLENSQKTILEFPKVSATMLRQVKELLARETPVDKIREGSPKESLESYFLKKVAESSAKIHNISGARIGAGVATYLQDKDYQSRISGDQTAAPAPAAPSSLTHVDHDRLAALEAAPTKPLDAPVVVKPPEVDQSALQQLSVTPSTAPVTSPVEKPVDTKLLDELAKKKKS